METWSFRATRRNGVMAAHIQPSPASLKLMAGCWSLFAGSSYRLWRFQDLSFVQYLQPLSIKQPRDPHERDSQHIHFVPWLNSLALQGEASGASSHHYHYHHHHHHHHHHYHCHHHRHHH
ncbi:hypothetical protein E2C01_034988 [Portunus trituberculatus]|uniref:Uncharacterized protein n=1 Tax=Portunus trituberculatus TaxID=210409 RepID=A0A5B7F780_PORTR|nr:hypothetical protein [Portunus trituberculatus]